MASRVTQVTRTAIAAGVPAARVTQVTRTAIAAGVPAARVTQVTRTAIVGVAVRPASSDVDWRG